MISVFSTVSSFSGVFSDSMFFNPAGTSEIPDSITNLNTTPDTPPSGNHGGGGWSSSTYAITVEKSEHGKVTSNRTNASSNSTVTRAG